MGEASAWEDPDFPPNHTSIGCAENSKLMRTPSWEPITKLFPERPLFAEIDPNDLQQGILGDCWLISAFQTMAEYPDTIKKIFQVQEHPADGQYVLRLYNIGKEEWQDVKVDGYIPCLDGAPAFVKPAGKGVWLCLVEKACAKMMGSYMKLEGGVPEIGYKMFVGPGDLSKVEKNSQGVWKDRSISSQQLLESGQIKLSVQDIMKYGSQNDGYGEKVEKDQLFSRILEWDRNHFLMSCGCRPTVPDPDALRPEEVMYPNGIVAYHSFGLLAAYEGHDVRLLQLRNPWGNQVEWNGAWCDDSELWTQHPEVAKDVNFKPRADGIFWMSFEDWHQNFGDLSVLKLEQTGPRAALMIQPGDNVRQEKERQKKEAKAKKAAEEMYSNGGWYVGKGRDFMNSKDMEEVRIWHDKELYEEVVKMCSSLWKYPEIQTRCLIDEPRMSLPPEVRKYLRARWQQKIEEERAGVQAEQDPEKAEEEGKKALEQVEAEAKKRREEEKKLEAELLAKAKLEEQARIEAYDPNNSSTVGAPVATFKEPKMPAAKEQPVFMGVKGAKLLEDGEYVRYRGMDVLLSCFKKDVEDGIIEATEPTEPTEPQGEAVVNSVRGKLSLREKPES